ncbi:hypothetical protein V495_07845 [Pseudogymnoascus sp. VKM F-4514 (FW-929)]|nr:hypothetical protein V490_04260 [Pseudogymnoascus sp. VKM F-3557]KFY36522.1 hypothetical protein V495_07845 [Pseudogymnoascus sp. VKM F-4514 (FW-929)]KFY58435.1 hypothetical protein V497_04842 [Pseudogymnoascus sp. VKM F-4516 (FW-969)]
MQCNPRHLDKRGPAATPKLAFACAMFCDRPFITALCTTTHTYTAAAMSYAAAASKGPRQSPEEARAPAPPEVEHSESASTASLIDVDSEGVHTVPADFKEHDVQTNSQAERIEREAEALKAKAIAEEKRLKKEFAEKEKVAKEKAKKAAERIEKNSDNPVFIGNAVAVVALSAGLGFGAYRKYINGELTWKVVGAWTGLVGLFAAGDFYLSKYLFKNKYPERK